ncbi:MAG: hypothetical protein LBD59_04425 [Prevotellaceae bacterium]|nr:hypothetical protein [Prevotellaceae bacterium]
MFGRGCASSGLSWQAAPANKGANAGTACKDRVDKVEPCPNSRGGVAIRRLKPPVNKVSSLRDFADMPFFSSFRTNTIY